MATLDQLSGGRVSLGVGSGWSAHEYESFGGSLAERGARMEESLSLLRKLWTEEDVESSGRFWQFPPLTTYPRPAQAPHPAAACRSAKRRAAHWRKSWGYSPAISLAVSMGNPSAALVIWRGFMVNLALPITFVPRSSVAVSRW